jgi:hypothetical protein
MNTRLRRLASSVALTLALIAVVAPSHTAQAIASRTTCFQNYVGCMDRAGNLPTFIQRSAAGLDCSVDLVACVRGAILGF